MPLSAILLTVEMTFECPHCGRALVKTGSWFQTIGRFQCRDAKTQSGYPITTNLCSSTGTPIWASSTHATRKPAPPGMKRGPTGGPIFSRRRRATSAARTEPLELSNVSH
jgi:hypothetical protein